MFFRSYCRSVVKPMFIFDRYAKQIIEFIIENSLLKVYIVMIFFSGFYVYFYVETPNLKKIDI